MKRIFIKCTVFSLILFFLWNCKEEQAFTTNPGDLLSFELDTISFDTVFTERGSVTKIMKIYNRHDQSLRVDKIYFELGDESKFRFNVDGFLGPVVEGLEIAANDSTYVFVEVTIDPGDPVSASPFVIEENFIFRTNGVNQKVLVDAWGQNANYIPGLNLNNTISLLSCNNGTITFDDDKPYVVFGALIIDSCMLEIVAGTRIYVHGGISRTPGVIFNGGFIIIGRNGQIRCNGTVDEPIIWSTDRLEESFRDDPGQWSGIRITSGSTGNVFRSTIIQNSIIGIEVDSAASVFLDKTQIHTTSGTALIGIHASITAENCLFANNGASAVEVFQGGVYNFEHCTFANFGTDRSAISIANYRCLDNPRCSQRIGNDLVFNVRNSIIFGSMRDEILLSAIEEAGFNYSFDNCIVKTDEITDDFPDFFDNCIACFEPNFGDPLFLDLNEDIYLLDTMSVAIDKGAIIGVSTDINGNRRDSSPDLGCYEFQD